MYILGPEAGLCVARLCLRQGGVLRTGQRLAPGLKEGKFIKAFVRAVASPGVCPGQGGVLWTGQRLVPGLEEEILIRLYFRRNDTVHSTSSRAVVKAVVIIIARIECKKESRDPFG
jgi:hypothetical protein